MDFFYPKVPTVIQMYVCPSRMTQLLFLTGRDMAVPGKMAGRTPQNIVCNILTKLIKHVKEEAVGTSKWGWAICTVRMRAQGDNI